METPPGSPIGPIRPEERIPILDILRGFALLGIAILNMKGFKASEAIWFIQSSHFSGPINRGAEWAIEAFGSGKFNSTFSFLFGVGLTVQMARAEARGVPFVGLYLRRLAVLLVLGLLHSILLWNGDVLQIYAVIGLGLLLVRKWPDGLVLALAVVLLVAPIVNKAVEATRQAPAPHTQAYYEKEYAQQVQIYAQGSYGAQVRDRLHHLRESYLVNRDFWFHAEMGVTMLLGFLAGRRKVFQNIAENLPMFRKVWRWGLLPGLALGAFASTAWMATRGQARPTLFAVTGWAAYELARPMLALAYMAGLVLLSERPGWRERLSPLAIVGRMPLTNYLMQSVMATTIFYSFGLGYFGKVGPAVGLLISLAIFAVQVVYSRWWMARFEFGPLEWLWRAVTYGRWPTSVEVRTAVASG